MTKKFNLSEKAMKIHSVNGYHETNHYHEEDVKEFIRLLKEEIGKRWASEIIDKLAGEKLK